MNNAIKTSIAASLALLISFVMLFTYLDMYTPGNAVTASNETISSDVPGEKRVFLIGSSYVERLNETYIKQYLSENGLQQFQVYNIAKNGAGNPSQQSVFLGPILSAHPTIIVYGLGFRELGYKPYTDNIPNCALNGTASSGNSTSTSFHTPAIQDAVTYVQQVFHMPTDFSNIPDPKHVTVDILKSSFNDNATSIVGSAAGDNVNKTLFEKREPLFTDIKSLDEINKPLDYTVHVCPQDMQNELGKLNEMVSAFKKNNIKVILFVPPFSSSYLNAVGTDGIQVFLSALEKFSKENNLQLYDMHDKYVKLNIWADAQHVAQNPKVVVYSDDLAQIILKELQSFTNLRTVDTRGNDLSHADLSNADLRSVDLSGKNLTGATLEYSNLYGANMDGTILTGANLAHAYMRNLDLSDRNLAGTILTGADLTGANLNGDDLSDKNLTGTNLSGVDLTSVDLDGTVLTGSNLLHANLTGVDLSGKDLTGTNLSGVDLTRTNLDGAVLTEANLDYSDLRNTDLADKNLMGASLKGVYLSGKELTGTILVGTNLAYANFRGDDMTGKNLTGAFLYGTNFYDADLTGADLTGVNLRKTILTGANLDNAKLDSADLSSNSLINTQMVGVNLHNAILPGVNLANKDLTGTNLAGANLVNANLTGVDLSDKDLTGTNLRGANLDYAILVGINLGLKNMTGASLHGADLTNATLWKAKLVGVNLVDANLSHSDMRYAVIQNSNLTGADLSGANLSGASLSGDDLTGTIVVGTNMASDNLTGVDVSKTVTTMSGVKSTHDAGLTRAKVIANFQSGNVWIKQSSSGTQSYDKVDFVNGTQSLSLVTDGNGSPTVTRNSIISPPLDLNHTVVSTWMKVGNPSKVKELWMYFSSDGFKSAWYTYKIPISSQLRSGEWVKVTISLKDSVITGLPDMSAINKIQIRVNDDSTGPVTLHVNEISIQKEVSK